MNKKKTLGQFNTTNKDYILEGFGEFLSGKSVVDPFAGDGDLLSWAEAFGISESIGFDVDETKPFIRRDTLLRPLDYTGKWVLTNPPYLAQNKNPDKTLYQQYQLDDLYKIAIHTFCSAEGGVIIVPVNFLSAETSNYIRRRFFWKYDIKKCVVFEERVFDDTDYTVCAIAFEKSETKTIRTVPVTFKPSGKEIVYEITYKNDWVFGEDYFNLLNKPNDIGRFTEKNIYGDEPLQMKFNDVENTTFTLLTGDSHIKKNILLLRAIDTGTAGGRIKLYDVRDFGIHGLIGKPTSRNWAHIRFPEPPSIEEQERIIVEFNNLIEGLREKYNSIFLTAFRNSTQLGSRKRISFDAAYSIIKSLL